MIGRERNQVEESCYRLESYQFDLPEASIAQEPSPERAASRLLVLDRSTGTQQHDAFANLGKHIPAGALLVANNSKVLPARVAGTTERGRSVEFLLLTPLPTLEPQEQNGWRQALAEGLIKGAKRCKVGEYISFALTCRCRVLAKKEFGRVQVILEWKGDLAGFFAASGVMPLPPYIRRPATQEDIARYQTVYASEAAVGSVAAPTAGLHFTEELRTALKAQGFGWAEVTLYVGYGTFNPVRCSDIREHCIHAEYVEVSEETALSIRDAKRSGRPIVAIGTTTLRTLEGVVARCGEMVHCAGWLDIYIHPGFVFKAVDHLVTNFHLPGSSLLILASAMAGRERVLDAYREAVRQGYRFFSYGDAMFII